MPCRPQLALLSSFLWVATGVLAAGAIPPSESALPDTTKAFVSVANWAELEASFNKTQLGQLMHDPVMKPFTDDLRDQLQDKWTRAHQRLGLAWTDLEGVPAGEISLAVTQPSKVEAALVLWMDVTGHLERTNQLIAKVSERLVADKAVRSEREIEGTKVTIFAMPKQENRAAHTAVYFIKNDVLVATDELAVAEGVLGRMTRESHDNLASLPAFVATMKRCKAAAGELAPQVRWFVEPFGYVEAMRAAGVQRRKKGPDFLKILSSEGFTAVKGLGGFVNFGVDKYEVLHRTAVYAPPIDSGNGEKYQLAARMLEFPNEGNLAPLDWVPREIATYACFHWNVPKAFDASETLVNKVVNEDVFKETLLSIKADPNGPQIDIRNDLVGQLGNRITVITDYQLPIKPKSERMLVAVEARSPQTVAATIEKWMKSDEDARRHVIAGHVVWEIVAKDEGALPPMVLIENAGDAGDTGDAIKPEPREERRLPPNSAVTVAFGHLLYSTHTDLLARVLNQSPEREKLSGSADFQVVSAELAKLGVPKNAAQTFSRTDEEYRAVYELIRTGRMPEAETMLGKLLNNVLGEGKPGVLRKQKIDGDKLPDFEVVRRYFGPAGVTVVSEDDGWLLVGFTLSKEMPASK